MSVTRRSHCNSTTSTKAMQLSRCLATILALGIQFESITSVTALQPLEAIALAAKTVGSHAHHGTSVVEAVGGGCAATCGGICSCGECQCPTCSECPTCHCPECPTCTECPTCHCPECPTCVDSLQCLQCLDCCDGCQNSTRASTRANNESAAAATAAAQRECRDRVNNTTKMHVATGSVMGSIGSGLAIVAHCTPHTALAAGAVSFVGGLMYRPSTRASTSRGNILRRE